MIGGGRERRRQGNRGPIALRKPAGTLLSRRARRTLRRRLTPDPYACCRLPVFAGKRVRIPAQRGEVAARAASRNEGSAVLFRGMTAPSMVASTLPANCKMSGNAASEPRQGQVSDRAEGRHSPAFQCPRPGTNSLRPACRPLQTASTKSGTIRPARYDAHPRERPGSTQQRVLTRDRCTARRRRCEHGSPIFTRTERSPATGRDGKPSAEAAQQGGRSDGALPSPSRRQEVGPARLKERVRATPGLRRSVAEIGHGRRRPAMASVQRPLMRSAAMSMRPVSRIL